MERRVPCYAPHDHLSAAIDRTITHSHAHTTEPIHCRLQRLGGHVARNTELGLNTVVTHPFPVIITTDHNVTNLNFWKITSIKLVDSRVFFNIEHEYDIENARSIHEFFLLIGKWSSNQGGHTVITHTFILGISYDKIVIGIVVM